MSTLAHTRQISIRWRIGVSLRAFSLSAMHMSRKDYGKNDWRQACGRMGERAHSMTLIALGNRLNEFQIKLSHLHLIHCASVDSWTDHLAFHSEGKPPPLPPNEHESIVVFELWEFHIFFMNELNNAKSWFFFARFWFWILQSTLDTLLMSSFVCHGEQISFDMKRMREKVDGSRRRAFYV